MAARASDSVIDGPRLPQPLGQVLVGIAASVGQAPERLRLFERAEILPLDVLDERDLDNLVVIDVPDDDRQLAEADLHRRLVTPFAGDDLDTAPPRCRTISGSMMPFSAIDAMSSERSPMTWRG